jgi:aspartate kinase
VAVRPERVVQALEKGSVPVVGGAQGVSRAGEITFLGRGGTDTTAVALACALGAEKCELYTDVPGLFTADPRLVPEARLIERLSFDEMLAMCHAGCPKPAASSVELARRYGVPLRVRPAFTWKKGTWIGSCARATGPIAVLASADPTSADLTSADLTSADLTSADPASANGADGSRGRARVSIVCDAIDADPSAVSRTIDALAAIGIAVEHLSASESALTVVIGREQMRSAVLALHREFLPTADGRPRADAQLELLLTQQPEAEASGADRGNL